MDGRERGKAVLTELKAKVRTVPVEHSKVLLWYYSVANQIYTQTQVYMKENDLEWAYVLNLKLASLLVSTIPKHNAYNLKKYQREKLKYKQMAATALDNVEHLADAILLSYQYNDHAINKRIGDATPVTAPITTTTVSAAAKPSPASSSANTSSSTTTRRDEGQEDIKYPTFSKTSSLSSSSSSVLSSSSSSLYPSEASSSSSSNSTSGSTVLSGKLRRMHLSDDLVNAFMERAAGNTAKNTETCALLLGRLLSDAFYVTHLVLPQQSGNAHSTTTSHEEELITLQMKEDLLTLGWIHTHPSQSCFLSSIDLHTQFSYQCMLPEALAIVMAPTDRKLPCGVFSLTDVGQQVLEKCRLTGFHEHPNVPNNAPLFTQATHYVVSPSSAHKTTVIDLRR